LITAAFGKKEKGSGKFDSNPSIKKLGHRVLRFQMEIGARDMVQAIQANPLFLFNEPIATGNAQARKEQFAQVIQQPEVHRRVLTVWVSEISV
jgi:hypothetical protein